MSIVTQQPNELFPQTGNLKFRCAGRTRIHIGRNVQVYVAKIGAEKVQLWLAAPRDIPICTDRREPPDLTKLPDVVATNNYYALRRTAQAAMEMLRDSPTPQGRRLAKELHVALTRSQQ